MSFWDNVANAVASNAVASNHGGIVAEVSGSLIPSGIFGGPGVAPDPLGGMSKGPADAHDPNHGGSAEVAFVGGTGGIWDHTHTDFTHGTIELHTTTFETQLHI